MKSTVPVFHNSCADIIKYFNKQSHKLNILCGLLTETLNENFQFRRTNLKLYKVSKKLRLQGILEIYSWRKLQTWLIKMCIIIQKKLTHVFIKNKNNQCLVVGKIFLYISEN